MMRLASPADLLSAIPYLLGFHPSDSLVAVGLRDRRIAFVARGDLPAEPERLAGVLARQRLTGVMLVGYGPPETVTPGITSLRAALGELHLYEALRVTGGRWFSYVCTNPGCCPPEGTPHDPATNPIAATATVAGLVALPSRDDVGARVAPVGGPGRAAMTVATARALRLARPVDTAGEVDAEADRVALAVERYAAGGRLTDDELADLTVALAAVPVRDRAMDLVTPATVDTHLALWTDAVRRAEPSLVAPAAALLAFTAWQRGDGPLATVALDRADAADASYPLAALLRSAIECGLPPSTWRPARTTRPPTRRRPPRLARR